MLHINQALNIFAKTFSIRMPHRDLPISGIWPQRLNGCHSAVSFFLRSSCTKCRRMAPKSATMRMIWLRVYPLSLTNGGISCLMAFFFTVHLLFYRPITNATKILTANFSLLGKIPFVEFSKTQTRFGCWVILCLVSNSVCIKPPISVIWIVYSIHIALQLFSVIVPTFTLTVNGMQSLKLSLNSSEIRKVLAESLKMDIASKLLQIQRFRNTVNLDRGLDQTMITLSGGSPHNGTPESIMVVRSGPRSITFCEYLSTIVLVFHIILCRANL